MLRKLALLGFGILFTDHAALAGACADATPGTLQSQVSTDCGAPDINFPPVHGWSKWGYVNGNGENDVIWFTFDQAQQAWVIRNAMHTKDSPGTK